jgi:L-cysteine S-thiosulfotransferase
MLGGMSTRVAASAAARIVLSLIALTAASRALAADAERPQPLKSGIEFASNDVRSLQADDFANPGMLWVTRGESSWKARAGAVDKTCADCHGNAA